MARSEEERLRRIEARRQVAEELRRMVDDTRKALSKQYDECLSTLNPQATEVKRLGALMSTFDNRLIRMEEIVNRLTDNRPWYERLIFRLFRQW